MAQDRFIVPPNLNSPDGILNQSYLIPISTGDSFYIRPNIEFGKKEHHLLKGILKAVGFGSLGYTATSSLSLGKGTASNNKRISLPAIGVGIAMGAPDFIKAIKNSKKTTLAYNFYSKDMVLLSGKRATWDRKSKDAIAGVASSDGFLRVTMLKGGKSQLAASDLLIDIAHPPKANGGYMGGIAASMGMRSDGDCMPDISWEQGGIEYHFWDDDGDGHMDRMTYWDEGSDSPVIIPMGDYPFLNESNMGDIMSSYDPEIFPSIDFYLDWYEINFVNPPTESPCVAINNATMTSLFSNFQANGTSTNGTNVLQFVATNFFNSFTQGLSHPITFTTDPPAGFSVGSNGTFQPTGSTQESYGITSPDGQAIHISPSVLATGDLDYLISEIAHEFLHAKLLQNGTTFSHEEQECLAYTFQAILGNLRDGGSEVKLFKRCKRSGTVPQCYTSRRFI